MVQSPSLQSLEFHQAGITRRLKNSGSISDRFKLIVQAFFKIFNPIMYRSDGNLILALLNNQNPSYWSDSVRVLKMVQHLMPSRV
jgi:hypothetical protein